MPSTTRVLRLPDTSIDLRTAAEHAGVEFRDVIAAVARRELTAADTDPGRPGVWMGRTGDVSRWAATRAGR